MQWVLGFLAAFALMVVWLVFQARKAGPRQVGERALERSRAIVSASRDAPDPGWGGLGSKTTVRGLDVLFDHDDDPQAEATLFVPGRETDRPTRTLANRMTVDLTHEWSTHHVHTSGYAFRVRLRGQGAVIGRQTRIQMVVDGEGEPLGGRIENDDDTRAAVGDWIEVECAEILEVPNVGG